MQVTAHSSPVPGRRRFRLRASLGEGAFGRVYLADVEGVAGFRRTVALKVLRAQWTHVPEVARRLRDEARVLGWLTHPHIVDVLDLVHLDEGWAVVLEYVPGTDLHSLVNTLAAHNQTVPWLPALEIGARIFSAVAAAAAATDHEGRPLQIVHRDLKPSNVRLTAEGDLKVLDYGVARFRQDVREARTRAPGWIGTEAYLAPERLRCEGDTVAGDVYAAGATLYELLAGEPLGRSPGRTHLHVDWLVGRLNRLDGPPDAIATLGLLLDADPERRPTPRDAAQQLQELARRLDGPPLSSYARRVVPAVEAAASPSVPLNRTLHEQPTAANPHEASTLDVTIPAPRPTTQAPRNSSVALQRLVLGASLMCFAVVLVVLSGVGAWWTNRNLQGSAPAAPVAEAPTTPVAASTPHAKVDSPVAAEPAPARRHTALRASPRPVPTVKKAHVSAAGATRLEVRCGQDTVTGTASVRLADMPAGRCTATAELSGRSLQGGFELMRPITVQCSAADDRLRCELQE